MTRMPSRTYGGPFGRLARTILFAGLMGPTLSGLTGCGDTMNGNDRPPSSPDGSFARKRNEMVDAIAPSISDGRVLDAMRKVPRHLFVPAEVRDRSYLDVPLPIGEGQTISQPTIVAIMTALLNLDGTERVLEVGTGSGYQAAVLAELAREVYTVEILPGLSQSARETIEELRRIGAISTKPTFVVGDGNKGYEPSAPYDAIIVTAAPTEVPGPLLEQLKAGGRLVIPVGDYYQELKLITKDETGKVTEESMKLVRFVRLVPGDEKE